jgi:ArsR family transcriptional regulator
MQRNEPFLGGMTSRACSIDEHARRPVRALNAEHLHAAARMLAAAGDVNRLKLLVLLRSGRSDVVGLATSLGRRSSYISQQLAVLRGANLVRAERRGTRVIYSLVDHHAEQLVDAALAFAFTRKG